MVAAFAGCGMVRVPLVCLVPICTGAESFVFGSDFENRSGGNVVSATDSLITIVREKPMGLLSF